VLLTKPLIPKSSIDEYQQNKHEFESVSDRDFERAIRLSNQSSVFAKVRNIANFLNFLAALQL